jgi:hypothetical protein
MKISDNQAYLALKKAADALYLARNLIREDLQEDLFYSRYGPTLKHIEYNLELYIQNAENRFRTTGLS